MDGDEELRAAVVHTLADLPEVVVLRGRRVHRGVVDGVPASFQFGDQSPNDRAGDVALVEAFVGCAVACALGCVPCVDGYLDRLAPPLV